MSKAIDELKTPEGGIDHNIFLAAAEVITATERHFGRAMPGTSWFNPASTPEHHVPGMAGQKGVAVDFMVYGDRNMGNFVADYIWAARNRLGVCWIIWQRHIRSNTWTGHVKPPEWQPYNGSNPHTDHIHANFGLLLGLDGYGSTPHYHYHALDHVIGHGHVKGYNDRTNPHDEHYVNDGSFLWGWNDNPDHGGKANQKFRPYQKFTIVSHGHTSKGDQYWVTDHGEWLNAAYVKKD